MQGAIAPFPDTHAAVPTEKLVAVYGAAPDRLRRAIAGLDRDAMTSSPGAGRWSIQEIVCHVADSDVVGAVRFRQVLSGTPDAKFPGYDQDRWARGLGYRERGPEEVRTAIDLVAMLRETVLALLGRVGPSDWARTGWHGEFGTTSLRQLLELYADHGERHLDQIAARRAAIGSPAALELILENRLP